MEGLLQKWTNYISGWQSRFFTLKDDVLSYYTDEVDVGSGCKGAVKVSACEILVHTNDSCRFDIVDPGEQRYYLRAVNSQERQKWIVALGSSKAGLTSENLPSVQKMYHLIAEKRSELRINRDLLFQQIANLNVVVKQYAKSSKEIEESSEALKEICDALLSTSDELIILLTPPEANIAKRAWRRPTSVSSANGIPFSNNTISSKSCVPTGLQTPLSSCTNNNRTGENASNPVCAPGAAQQNLSVKLGALLDSFKSRKGHRNSTTSSQVKNKSMAVIGAQLRSLRLSRPYQTFFSTIEFSFEDFLPSTCGVDTKIRAVEFLASSRSLVKFFDLLATADESGQPILSRLGSLQTLYSDLISYIYRLEIAVTSLSSSSTNKVSAPPEALSITLNDIIQAEVDSGRCSTTQSAYLALLWLSRSLNFCSELLLELFGEAAVAKPLVEFSSTGLPLATSESAVSNAFVITAATSAYARTLSVFHDFVLRNTAKVIMQSSPSYSEIRNVLLLLDPSTTAASAISVQPEAIAQLHIDVDRYVASLKRCVQCIHSMFIGFGLDPVVLHSAPTARIAETSAEPDRAVLR